MPKDKNNKRGHESPQSNTYSPNNPQKNKKKSKSTTNQNNQNQNNNRYEVLGGEKEINTEYSNSNAETEQELEDEQQTTTPNTNFHNLQTNHHNFSKTYTLKFTGEKILNYTDSYKLKREINKNKPNSNISNAYINRRNLTLVIETNNKENYDYLSKTWPSNAFEKGIILKPDNTKYEFILKNINTNIDIQTNREFINDLTKQNVQINYRLIKKSTNTPLPCIRAFTTDLINYRTILTEGIRIGYSIHRCEPWIYSDKPLQCFRCLKFNHHTRDCKENQICLICAGLHKYIECPNKTNKQSQKCTNCNENHTSVSKSCKAMQQEIENTKNKYKTQSNNTTFKSYQSKAQIQNQNSKLHHTINNLTKTHNTHELIQVISGLLQHILTKQNEIDKELNSYAHVTQTAPKKINPLPQQQNSTNQNNQIPNQTHTINSSQANQIQNNNNYIDNQDSNKSYQQLITTNPYKMHQNHQPQLQQFTNQPYNNQIYNPLNSNTHQIIYPTQPNVMQPQDRINRKGGGVAIIHHKNITIQTITKDQTHETIAIKIELNDTIKLNLISTYYPPNCTYNLDFLEKIINDKENN
ncbi:Nucleic-acid-binding from transposon X, partial [Brachionus plicatilis]